MGKVNKAGVKRGLINKGRIIYHQIPFWYRTRAKILKELCNMASLFLKKLSQAGQYLAQVIM
jgi:hypothetical protein